MKKKISKGLCILLIIALGACDFFVSICSILFKVILHISFKLPIRLVLQNKQVRGYVVVLQGDLGGHVFEVLLQITVQKHTVGLTRIKMQLRLF